LLYFDSDTNSSIVLFVIQPLNTEPYRFCTTPSSGFSFQSLASPPHTYDICIPVASIHNNKMFYQHSNGSSTLPRGFRFHHEEGDRPITPEALIADEPEQTSPPSPPRPVRLKVRKRNASAFQAPTEHFLASVAAADVPIPTIEIPQIDSHTAQDSEMPDREPISVHGSGLLAPQSQDHRFFSPPKTPVPTFAFEEGSSHRPDWSMGTSSPDDYFKRPASSHSNTSDFSDDSFYSGSRVSRPSDDGSCTSPESDIGDPFTFPSISKGKGKAIHRDQPAEHVTTLNRKLRSKTRKDAPWTKAMSDHLWSTYMLYVQDPTVTPFRISASAVPPQGVLHRVAREAKRSWKGPKVTPAKLRHSARLRSPRGDTIDKSGSLTPTGETPRVYAQWPHSSSATRNQLRDLCKSRDNKAVQIHHHFQSRSPTPFTKSYRQIRSEEPVRISAFNTKDIVLSLTTSTAESMQPDGPLAQLAADESSDTPTTFPFSPLEEFKPLGFGESRGISLEQEPRNRRLGSPFIARTYGPSTSKTLNLYDRPSSPPTQSDNAQPFLRSPLKFEPRSLNGTMKRRAQHDLEEELSSNGAVLRPSILDEQLFGTALNQRRVRSRGFSLGDEALAGRVPSLFQRPGALPVASGAQSAADLAVGPPKTSPTLLPAATFEPPRLGSPFSESGLSQTFPRRLLQDGTTTIRRSAFATMHQTRRSIESFDFGDGPSLQSRLSNLDQRLSEIRERGGAARRQNFE
jgi:hypothetical protein